MHFDLKYGGRQTGKTDANYKYDWVSKFYLSTEGFYFKYRTDKYSPDIIRATLHRSSDNSEVEYVIVTGAKEKGHHEVINHFEARITLGFINA